MSTHTVERLVVRETGWSKARTRRGKGVRTCLPALDGGDAQRTVAADSTADSHIVRGED